MAFLQDVQTGVQIQPSANGLETFIHLSQGENGRKLYIKILGIDEIPAGSVATISGTKPDGNVYSAAGIIDDITIVFNEDIQMTVEPGIWDANVKIVNEGNVIASAKLRFVIHESAVASGAVPSDSQLDGIITECQMYAETARSAAYGSPLTASAAADMIDTSKVYVYTGSETGYAAGHWYYYNGTAWADGGVYNSIAFQTDTTLTLPDHAADAKATGDALATKADKIGNIALAERLYGGEYTSGSEPYHFRQAPEGMGAKAETIVGGSLGWNQLCNDSSVTVQSGHKYIAKISGSFSIGVSTGTAITGLTSGTDMVTDLTALFGSTIADYIYSLETATAGAGVAWVKRYIDLDTYHEYDAGSIQSVEGLESHDVVGFNQWDEEWEVYSTTGIQSKNAIPVIEGATYYIKMPSGYASINNVDKDRNYISYIGNKGNITFTIPLGCKYIQIICGSYGTTYNHDICINLSDPSRNGTYEPYEKHSYPLDSSVTLRGVPKLVTDHIEFDGDKYRSDGTVKRRCGKRAYQSGDESLANAITDGTTTVYKLTTPTTETAQPFQSPMIVGATEEYVSDSVVPVGHESRYYEDVAKKVNGLPKDFSTLIAPVEVAFTATRNYSVGSYLIVKNQLYKVTSAISSGGTITPNSNVTATTIMAEILALA